MKPSDVPVKTETGNQELAHRKHKLSPRSRSLLIVIHGTETVAELTRNLHALGDIEDSLSQLAGLGLITMRERAASAQVLNAAANSPDIIPPAQQVKQLLNETAVAVLGLRSFLFVLKLEHAYTAEDLRAIFPEYRRVFAKVKGEPFADSMVRRAEAMLARG